MEVVLPLNALAWNNLPNPLTRSLLRNRSLAALVANVVARGATKTRVVFLAGQGEEPVVTDGVHPPLVKTLLEPSSLAVGARLRHFAPQWRAITHDRWVLTLLSRGLTLNFSDKPPLSPVPIPFALPRDQGKAGLLRQEIKDMLVKRAIVPVKDPGTAGFYSLLFLVPKRNGTWRPVIDLSGLNEYLVVDKFKMTTPQSVRLTLSPGDWAISLDLKDAYFHIPIHPAYWKYLRFAVEGMTYSFVALPFGIATAPQVFTRVFGVIGAFLRQHGVSMIQYIDDWLVHHRDPNRLRAIVAELLPFLSHLGVKLNLAKSELVPTQRFTYIGVEFWTDRSLVLPPIDRVTKLQQLLATLRSRHVCTAREFLSLIGLINSMMSYVSLGRLRLRPLQWYLKDRYTPVSDPLTKSITLDWNVLRETFQHWQSVQWLRQGVPLQQPPHDLTLVTDASRHGWGGYLGNQEASGRWDRDHQSLHINVLELKAVLLCLGKFEDTVKDRVVLVLTDNTTAVHYINKQGGTHSRALNELTMLLLTWCQKRAISLLARHIVGSLNVLADHLSRDQIDPKEWTLSSQVTSKIFEHWGTPQVDLFANRWNHRLPNYVSPCPDPDAWGVDALSISWTGLVGYAYPPGSLLPKVLAKMVLEPCELILIAPLWPARVWYAKLLSLCTHVPLSLPEWKTLLRQPRAGKYASPDCRHRLNLHAWRLSSRHSSHRVFHPDQPEPFAPPTGRPPSDCMTADGRSLLVGVSRGTRVLSRPLFP